MSALQANDSIHISQAVMLLRGSWDALWPKSPLIECAWEAVDCGPSCMESAHAHAGTGRASNSPRVKSSVSGRIPQPSQTWRGYTLKQLLLTVLGNQVEHCGILVCNKISFDETFSVHFQDIQLSLGIGRRRRPCWFMEGKMNQYMIIKNLLDSRHSYVLYIRTFIIHSTAIYEEPTLLGAGHQCKLRQISYSDNAQIITGNPQG